jgi:uncharacterized protein
MNSMEDIIFSIKADDLADEPCTLYYRPLTGETSFLPITLSNKETLPIHRMSSINDIRKMSILPNNKCNFNCSYCYAAQGRDTNELSMETIEKALNYFINKNRTSKPLSVAILGGGEPLLSWNVTQYAIKTARELSKEEGVKLELTLVTNASLISEEIIKTLKDNDVIVNASFDLIEDVQNIQRKNFFIVKENIKYLSASRVYVTINSTITPMNVERMDEMVINAAEWFPNISFMIFEPVISTGLFTNSGDLRDFYQKYIEGFNKARYTAQSLGMDVTCRILKSLDFYQERGCEGRFNICPNGDITICYCTASAKDPNFKNRLYGKITPKEVKIFEDKFKNICNENVYSFEKCNNCFAKFNCAGGCMLPNDRYSKEFLDEVCYFNKEFIRRELYNRTLT